MSRWYVYKDSENLSRQWAASPVHKNWWESPQSRCFPQWHMAQEYANRMARTAPPEPYGFPTNPYTH